MHPIDKAVTILNTTLSGLATSLGISRGAVSQWKTNGVPACRCLAIESLTGGAVTRKELRPNDWHVYWPDAIVLATPAAFESQAKKNPPSTPR